MADYRYIQIKGIRMFSLIKRLIAVGTESTKLHELESMEKYSRKYGKIAQKLDDESIKRSNYKTLKKRMRRL